MEKTEKLRQIAELIDKGKTNEEIAGITGYAASTIKDIIYRFNKSHGLSNRNEFKNKILKNADESR